MIKAIETAMKLLAEIDTKAAAEARYYQGAKDGIGLLIETLKAGQADEADDSKDNKVTPKRASKK